MKARISEDTRNEWRSQRREKDMETFKKLMMNLTHLEYYAPRLRDNETKKLPPCFSRQNNVHKINPNKNHCLGYGCNENKKLICEVLESDYISQTDIFPPKFILFCKERPNQEIVVSSTTKKKVKRKYQTFF